MKTSETRRLIPHVHLDECYQQPVCFWPCCLSILCFPLLPLNELHRVEFRQSTPSCGPLVNVNPTSWELKEYLLSPLSFFFLCAFVATSLTIASLCVCRRRGQFSGEPRPSSLMFQRIRMPSTRLVHSLEMTQHLRYNNIGTVGPSVNDAQFFFSCGKKKHTLPF